MDNDNDLANIAMDVEVAGGVLSRLSGAKRKSTTPLPKGDPKTRAQRKPNLFQREWLVQDAYIGWLSPVENDSYQAKCIACSKKFLCGNAELKVHAETADHKANIELFYSSNDIPFGVISSEEVDRLWKLKDAVQTAEEGIAQHMVENKFDLRAAESFIHLIKEIVPDSAIAADFSLERCLALYNSGRQQL